MSQPCRRYAALTFFPTLTLTGHDIALERHGFILKGHGFSRAVRCSYEGGFSH